MEESQYGDEAFAHPAAVCDVVMKGGIASGVVYPLAIVELAKRFRFASVGGTSAGAHAAAAAAAAEYGRHVPGKGFARLALAPAEIARQNLSFLQPSPAVKPLFDMFLAAITCKGAMATTTAVAVAAIKGFPLAAIGGFLPGFLVAMFGARHGDVALLLLGLLLAVIGVIACLAFAAWRTAAGKLPLNDYGLCSGLRQPGRADPGNTDWLADLIDDIAGRDPRKDPPLTFGDLAAAPDRGRPKIDLRMMTTNLTLRRPYSLPLNAAEYAFRRADFERLFPQRIVKFLVEHCERVDEPGTFIDLYRFPDADHLPVVVAARMSATLPFLFSAVPLYAKDLTLRKGESERWRRNLFSDGGLSSNFPIHFFDRMLPRWPTFAISLDEYDERRSRSSAPPGDPRSRVWLPDPTLAESGMLIAGRPLHGLAAFVVRLVDAAKDWQDNLQATLAGSRDRIVHVDLKPDEGGLNLAMPPAVALVMAGYGAEAGVTLRDQFNFDEHRWRRFLVAITRLDETLEEFAAAYDGNDADEAFAEFLARYASNPPQSPLSYRQSPDDLKTLLTRARELAELGRRWRSGPDVPEEALPHPKTDMRITPRM